jgi:hypothetical protein
MNKFEYVITLLKNELKEYYISSDMKKELREAIRILKKENKKGKVIFKAKLKKGENLSKVIEQVLYPKYIGKEIIIRREVK